MSSQAFFLVFLLDDGVTGFCRLFVGAIPKLKQMLNENDVLSIEEQVLRRSVEERVLSSEKQVSRRKC
jgi:regulator of replication initiation timing